MCWSTCSYLMMIVNIVSRRDHESIGSTGHSTTAVVMWCWGSQTATTAGHSKSCSGQTVLWSSPEYKLIAYLVTLCTFSVKNVYCIVLIILQVKCQRKMSMKAWNFWVTKATSIQPLMKIISRQQTHKHFFGKQFITGKYTNWIYKCKLQL